MAHTKILLLLVIVNCLSAQVTDEQYASMPTLFYQDNYDNCMLRRKDALYCTITFILKPIDRENPSETWNIVKNVSSLSTNYRHDHLRHSICVPETCPDVSKSSNSENIKRGIERCYNEKYKNLGIEGTISNIFCQTEEPIFSIDWLDMICGICFVLYISFIAYATFYEGMARYKSEEEYKKLTSTPKGKILSAWALTRNWIRFKTINRTPENKKLRCIQGIRVYNTGLVVLSHTVLTFILVPLANPKFAETMHEEPSRLFFASGPLCVSTNFLMSSFLLTNGLFDYMMDKKGLSWRMCLFAFANRLFRLTPTVATVVLFHATWLRHLDRGPLWHIFIGNEYKRCRKNGWLNLLYINNWVNIHNMCIAPTWYLALETQYFLLNILFIWFLKVYEKYIWHLFGLAMALQTVGAFLQNFYYDFSALVLPTPEIYYGLNKLLENFQFHYQLASFIGNLSGMIMGTAFGYYFFKHKNDVPENKLFNTKSRVTLWWILTFGLAVSYVVFPGMIILQPTTEHNRFWASVYVAFSRPIFCFAIGVLILGFTEGIGWLALRVVQWPPTYILGRLSFSAYLIHTSIIMIRPGLARFPTYVTNFQVVAAFFGDLALVYIAATLLTLFVELPVSEIQKLIFVQKEKKKEKKNK